MTNEASEAATSQAATSQAAVESPQPSRSRATITRELELELTKLRNEASAARFEAKAAELELVLQRYRESLGNDTEPDPTPLAGSTLPAERFAGWEEIRTRLLASPQEVNNQPQQAPDQPQPAPEPITASNRPAVTTAAPDGSTTHRTKPRQSATPRQSTTRGRVDRDKPKSDRRDTRRPLAELRSVVGEPKRRSRKPEIATAHDTATKKRRRPAAWLVSFIVHVGLLLILGFWTLATQPPRDQVALAASTSDPAAEPMETFVVEATEPELEEPVEPLTEPEIETSPVGEIPVAEFSFNPSPELPTPESFAATTGTTSELMSVNANADASEKMEFCGVEGGGNHFVYLVDSSGSMGAAFESARAELLRSIALLGPEQRFYVIFFDENPDYMRLDDPSRDEPASVPATPEHKRRLARWAVGIRKDRGRAPYEPLRFALELRPDVIFLLSDGEFPQRIEDQLRNENRYENLFGDSGPISIVHTIGYHSREGETRMRRIAEQNGGQYRHVPKR